MASLKEICSRIELQKEAEKAILAYYFKHGKEPGVFPEG